MSDCLLCDLFLIRKEFGEGLTNNSLPELFFVTFFFQSGGQLAHNSFTFSGKYTVAQAAEMTVGIF